MTRKELITAISLAEDIETKAAAERVLDVILDTITTEIKSGGEVALGQSFGVFKAAKQAAKSGVALGKPYTTPEKTVIKFKASAALKREVA